VAGFGAGALSREVVVPPAATMGEGNRLPIFESVESDWFRRGRHSSDRATSSSSVETAAGDWTSAADEGWRAAQAVSKPASGGVTTSGLPKRVPNANLVPGTVSGEGLQAPPPVRSPSLTRERFANFQRGIREGRAATHNSDDDGGEEDGAT
jgi:hypothetical protein